MGGRLHLGLVYGGCSAEHEVSVVSARSIVSAIDPEQYDLTLIRIDQGGVWRLTGHFGEDTEHGYIPEADSPAQVMALTHGGQLIELDYGKALLRPLDVVFPALHGTNGEDGTIQGLLALYDIPCVGAGVLASAAGMDKVCTKRLLREANLPVVDFRVTRQSDPDLLDYSECVQALGPTLFVKPANTGSSVGISKVSNAAEFDRAIHHAFAFDSTVLVESAIDAREIECAVLGSAPVRVSVCGEIVTSHEFYSYEAKYEDESSTQLIVPADLPAKTSDQIRDLAREVCRALDCEGMARVDFFLTSTGELFVNEINTIPGFTSVSMYPLLWSHTGVPFQRLIDELVQDAIARHRRTRVLRRTR